MTRLDRLLTLLDTGSTPATRKAAAVQIGEIQKCHPYDLHNLLNKVYSFLRSPSWETRIAAGHAIDNIAANAPLWDPAIVPPESADATATATAGEATTTQTPAPASAAAGYLSFDTFDILKVLANGTPLVASGGQEYDVMVEDMDPKELLAFQKKQVRQKLGLEGGGDFMDMGDMIRDEDFIITPEQAKQRKAAEEEAKKKTQEVGSLVGTEGMSARERAQAKRKQRLAASKGGSSKDHLRESQDNLSASAGEPNAKRARGLKTVVTEQTHTQTDKIVIESVVDQDKAYDSREWPFAPLCETLCDDLFNPNWESRHGAAIGLREVLRRHGPGAGKTADARSSEESANQNTAFLDDCAIRLLCVLALDRFGDFVSQMVAPVRESCAQALGTVIKFMRPSSVLLVLDNLLKLGERVQWEVRHVGLLGIKYLVGVRIDLVDQILPRVLHSIVVGLMDDDDDVRAVAADTLHPITSAIVKNSPGSLPQILSTLWDILLDLDDLTASTPSVMNLLAEFYNQPSLLASLTNPSSTSISLSLPTHELIPRLWPFLSHSNPLVRTATLKMLERLVRFLTPVLPDAMAHVYQTILIDDREDIRNAAHHVWDSILRTNEAVAIRVAAFNLYGNWLYLAGTPQGAPLEPTLMVLAHKSSSLASSISSSSETVSKPKGRGRGRGRGKKEAVETTPSGLQGNNNSNNNNNKEEERKDGAVGGVRLRSSGSKAIGSLLRSWPTENAQEVFVPLVELLISPWASHQHTAALVLADAYYCEISPNPFPALPDVIKEKLDVIVNAQVPPPYGEVDSLIITSLRSDAKVLSQSLLSMGLTIEDLQFFNEEESNLETCSLLATAVYESCLQKLQMKLTPQILDQLEARRKRLLVTIGYLQTYHGQLLISNQGAAAGALVSGFSIPEKITPVVRSLMNSVKCEEDDILQRRAGHALGHLVVQCTSRKMCPNNKILQNLIQGLVEDRSYTPLVTAASILGAPANGIKKETKKKKENGDDAPSETMEAPPAPEDPRLVLARKGSIIALRSIVSQFGDKLFEGLPKIWDFMVQPVS